MLQTVQQRLARYQTWRLWPPVDRPMFGLIWEPDIPLLLKMLSVARQILDAKPLLLAALDVESAECCRNELPSAGLCLMLAVSGGKIPPKYCEWIEEHCR